MEENCDLLARRVPSFAQGKRILLVDRDASSLTYIASVLESHSYKVTTIELESVAMSIFSEHKDEYDAVMVDMNMKDMTSLEFVHRILLTKSYTPIILMSSRGDEATVNQALIDGACHFLEKPIPKDQLVQIWQHVHRLKKLSEEEEAGNYSGSRTSISISDEAAKLRLEKGINGTKRSAAGIQIRDDDQMGNDSSRPASAGVDLLLPGIINNVDPKGKKKQVEGEVDLLGLGLLDSKLPIGLTMDGVDDLRMEANERLRGCGRSSRKRPSSSSTVDDIINGDNRKFQRNERSDQQYSHLSGDTGRGPNPSEEERANPKKVQYTMNGSLTQPHASSHLQRYKTQNKSMSNSREDTTTLRVSSRNASAFYKGAPQSSLDLRLGDGGWSRSSSSGSRPSLNFPNQFGWQSPISLSSFSHGRDLVPDANPFAYASISTNVINPTDSVTGAAMLPLAQASRSANPDPTTTATTTATDHVALDDERGDLQYLTEWLRNPSLDQDNPHIQQPFDGSHC